MLTSIDCIWSFGLWFDGESLPWFLRFWQKSAILFLPFLLWFYTVPTHTCNSQPQLTQWIWIWIVSRQGTVLAVWLNTSPAAPASPAPLLTSPAGDVCKYYIGPSVACLSVMSSAAAVATQRRADRRRRVYDCPTAARSRQVSSHVVLLDAQSACPSADRWSHLHAIEMTRRCYIINGRWCRKWRRWGQRGQWCI